MRQIKRFTGNIPPVLKKGEWATNDYLVYIGTENGKYKMFQGALDLQQEQYIVGLHLKNAIITIPNGTPLSKVQELFSALPKTLISNKYQSSVLRIKFEAGTYVNDMNKWIEIKNFQYNIIIQGAEDWSTSNDKRVVFELSHSFEVYSCYVRFERVKFKYWAQGGEGALYGYNANVDAHFCAFEAMVESGAIYPTYHSSFHLKNCHFKMFSHNVSPIFKKVDSSKAFVRNSVSDPAKSPKNLAGYIRDSIAGASEISSLGFTAKSPTYGAALELLGAACFGDEVI